MRGTSSERKTKRAVDCDKVKADPNGAQPSEAERQELAKVSGKLRPDIGNFDVRVGGLEAIPDAERVLAANKAKFGPWWCSSRWQDGSLNPNEHERTLLSLEDKLAQVKASELADAATAKANFEAAVAKALKRLDEYKAVPTLRFKGSDSLRSSSSDVNSTLDLTAKYHWLQLRQAQGESAPDVVAAKASLEAAQKKVKDTIDEIENMLADRYPMPKEEYHGKDASQVKAAFAKYFADKKVVTVVLVSDFERKTGSDWRGDTLVSYDHSWIHGNIITKLDDKTGEVWQVIGRRDHIDNNKMKFDTYVPAVLGKIRLAKVGKR